MRKLSRKRKRRNLAKWRVGAERRVLRLDYSRRCCFTEAEFGSSYPSHGMRLETFGLLEEHKTLAFRIELYMHPVSGYYLICCHEIR
jgi:hypothetical protein